MIKLTGLQSQPNELIKKSGILQTTKNLYVMKDLEQTLRSIEGKP